MNRFTNSQEAALLLSAITGAPALVGMAIQTGLLWRLRANPLNADAIAQALAIPPRRCRHWLELLQMMGSWSIRRRAMPSRNRHEWQ